MSLKNKVIILLLCVFGAYAIVEYTVQRCILLPSFVQLELTTATQNTERAVHALEREIEQLIPIATDWATWDDTYQFMADRNAEYFHANLNVQALASLNANLMEFYDTQGQRLWGIAYDHENEQELTPDEVVKDILHLAQSMPGSKDEAATLSGLYNTPVGLFMIASRPVLTSNGEGPSRGHFVVGRLLDKVAVERLGNLARVQLWVESLTAAEGSQMHQSDNSGCKGHTPIMLTEGQANTDGTTDMLDVRGVPILRFHVETPRTIITLGRNTLYYASISLAVAGTLVLLTILVFLRRVVFDPISLLTRHAMVMGKSDDLNSRLRMRRKDEIGILAQEFDLMVEGLAEARKRLMKQSYDTGVAEIASGALHNIGNTITPIGVKLINLRQELMQAPVLEMARAGAELADPATSAARKVDLALFSELAGKKLATLVTRATNELEIIHLHVDQVQMILIDQQLFSRAGRPIEPLALDRLLQETVELLPEKLRSAIHIEIDEGVAKTGRVKSARIALQQIVTNLFINAAESIGERGPQREPGRIRVYTLTMDEDQQELVHVCFEDNGMGIGPEQMPHLFERSFSTKSRGSGLGLHWCANTASALGGRIYATSSGPGQGACLHLLLPLADTAKTNIEPMT